MEEDWALTLGHWGWQGEPGAFQEGPQLPIKKEGHLGPWREGALDKYRED